MIPVSVCVPLTRHEMFEKINRPTIRGNDPAEVWISATDEHVCIKRNRMAQRARQPFLFFCDDDIALEPNALRMLLDALRENPRAAYAYCDYKTVNHPTRGTRIYKSKPFDVDMLRFENYISTMSLIRAEAFVGFDETLDRYQDWDLWLAMAEAGHVGVYVPQVLFTAVYDEDGITQSDGVSEAMDVVKRKHGLR